MCLFELSFSQGIFPAMGFLDHMYFLYSSLSLQPCLQNERIGLQETFRILGSLPALSLVFETEYSVNSWDIGGHLHHWSWYWLEWDNTCHFIMWRASLCLSSSHECLVLQCQTRLQGRTLVLGMLLNKGSVIQNLYVLSPSKIHNF